MNPKPAAERVLRPAGASATDYGGTVDRGVLAHPASRYPAQCETADTRGEDGIRGQLVARGLETEENEAVRRDLRRIAARGDARLADEVAVPVAEHELALPDAPVLTLLYERVLDLEQVGEVGAGLDAYLDGLRLVRVG